MGFRRSAIVVIAVVDFPANCPRSDQWGLVKPPRANHPRRARINSHLPAPLRHRLAAHCAAKGIYECEALKAAVSDYLDGTSDMTLLFRRLDAINRELQRLRRMLELNGELLKEFVQLFLKLTSGRGDVSESSYLRRAAARYQTLVERVAASITRGKVWLDDLPKEILSPDATTPADGAAPPAVPAPEGPR